MIGDLVKVAVGAKVRTNLKRGASHFGLFDPKEVINEATYGVVVDVEDTTFSNKFYRILLHDGRLAWALGTDISSMTER